MAEIRIEKGNGTLLPLVYKYLPRLDDLILVAVALGIIAAAVLLLVEAASDFVYLSDHSIPHIISDLMFVLIIMELFRQVMRQINRQAFSLNPFIYIGVIASIRGLLLTQMSLGLGEADWQTAVIQLSVHALIVLVLVIGLLVYSKVQAKPAD
ncbi:MAG: phosphate-starvation-inducible PsiE family protein [Thermodesulfobacteriota bacterium]|nr:MAG: phosphate-starvation-inducible PsiE family protein [Thermodesulfobacteriota bacterium]